MRRRYAGAAALLLMLGLAAGCSDGGGDPAPGASQDSTGGDATGSAEQRDPATPVRRILDWQPVAGSPAADVVDVGDSRVVVPQSGRRATLAGAASATVAAGPRRTFVDVLVGDGTAFLLALDEQEERPAAITALDLDTGEQRRVDTPTPAPDGASATGPHGFHYAAVDQGRFCLATLPPDAARGQVTWCAPPRQGWSSVSDTEAGVAFMTFDDRRPVSCRTLVRLAEAGGDPQPLEGVERCTAWDVALTATGHVWSTVPDESRVEQVEVHARADGTTYHLGAGTRSTLTPCGDSVFWVRDSPDDAAPARLMRWTAEDRLEIAYESPGRGPAFLSPPECSGGELLTVAAYGEGGDERVSATVTG